MVVRVKSTMHSPGTSPRYMIGTVIASTVRSSHADCVHGHPGQTYCTGLTWQNGFAERLIRIGSG